MAAIPAGGVTTQHQVAFAIQATSYQQVSPVAGHVAEVVVHVLGLIRGVGIGNRRLQILILLIGPGGQDNGILHHRVAVGRDFIMVVFVVHHEFGTVTLHRCKTTSRTCLIPVVIPLTVHIQGNGARAGGIRTGEIQGTILHIYTAGEIIGSVENQHGIPGLFNAGAGDDIPLRIHVVDNAGIGGIRMPGKGIAIFQLGIALTHAAQVILRGYIYFPRRHLAVDVYLTVLLFLAVHISVPEGNGLTIHIHTGVHGNIGALLVPAGMRAGTIGTPDIAHVKALVILASAGVAHILTAPDVAQHRVNQDAGIRFQANFNENSSLVVFIGGSVGVAGSV